MYLWFEPVKVNPLTPNLTYICRLNAAVHLPGGALAAAEKSWRFDSSRYNAGFNLLTSQPEQPQQSTVVGRQGCIHYPIATNFPREFISV